jgi:hypothetical protein
MKVNNKDKVVLKFNVEKQPTLRLINPKHPIYYVKFELPTQLSKR